MNQKQAASMNAALSNGQRPEINRNMGAPIVGWTKSGRFVARQFKDTGNFVDRSVYPEDYPSEYADNKAVLPEKYPTK